ncbi:MAG: CDP-glycerol glycerophosphotransferase family protein [Eubacterium sp.]|nr:CDP-glycerol glycerophosphotransferase family protein [Eubacterium sp.]
MSKLKDTIKKSKILNPIAHEMYYKYQDTRDSIKESAVWKKVNKAHPQQKEIKADIADLKHTWAFNAGDIFAGNPKWLFIYICKYRKDIEAYWICDSEKTVEQIKSLGYNAYTFKSHAAIKLQQRTGVFCVEQVKEQIPSNMPDDVILLNLYHGVGCKTIEKFVDFGFLTRRIAKKYITYNDFYYTHMLFLVTSPLMEEHFAKQMGLSKDNLIRAGYPRCMYQNTYEPISTFDGDILKKRGLPENTRIAAYVPTYRDDAEFDFWGNAIPDFDSLIKTLKNENILLIMKLHPQMINNPVYKNIQQKYKQEKHLMFWDNANDFYEIFPRIDVGIVDYSSIYYDMLAGGVKHFIRYFFDYEDKDKNLRDFVYDPEEMTSGTMCKSFDELLSSLEHIGDVEDAEGDRIYDLFWKYAEPDSFEKIVEAALNFIPKKESDLPTLYSYDIFDTLIARKVLQPKGIFFQVRYKMRNSEIPFPGYLTANYAAVREFCESNAREYYSKSLEFRKDNRREITHDMIFNRMQDLYEITDEQCELLKKWELEAELDNVIPCREKIDELLKRKHRGDRVLLLSDMYLDKEFIRKLLAKADPELAELPLFLSSDYGVQKTTGLLYLEAYLSEKPYQYKKWIHYGDNANADGKCAESLGITPKIHEIPQFNDYEKNLVSTVNSYDSYLMAAELCRFGTKLTEPKDRFVYSFVSLCFVPYINQVINRAMRMGLQTLYFISRDGYHLKRIADTIISEKKLPIKTKYIYGSRNAWRIPSFIDGVDDEFFSTVGNFVQVNTYHALLDALQLKDKEFAGFFPQYASLRTASIIPAKKRDEITESAKGNADYRKFLLDKAEKTRPIVLDYLKQEIDFSEKFAFVEYWGRGYTQTCFTRLLGLAAGNREMDDIFFYARSIYPSIGHDIRYNFAGKTVSLHFVEAIFANMPYNTVVEYKRVDGRVEPVKQKRTFDNGLYMAMRELLPEFARNYCRIEFLDQERLDRELFDFVLKYYSEHQDDPLLSECIGSLVDSIGIYGKQRPFAPPVTRGMINKIYAGENPQLLTSSYEMTKARSNPRLAAKFQYLTVTRKQRKKK